MAQSPYPSLCCHNCGQVHALKGVNEPRECFFFTIRRSGRTKLQPVKQIPSRPIPKSRHGRQKLRDLIWDEFESIKVENDVDREDLSAVEVSKGQLKMKAPIPWLSWIAPDGRTGQTRSKENFDRIWEEIVEHNSGLRPAWMSSVLLPCHFADRSD